MRRHKHFGNSLSTVNFDIYDSLFLFLWQFIPARMRAERILFCCLLLDQSPQLHSYLNDRKSDCLLLWRWRSQIYSSFEGLRLELKFRTGQFKRLIDCRCRMVWLDMIWLCCHSLLTWSLDTCLMSPDTQPWPWHWQVRLSPTTTNIQAMLLNTN